MNEAIKRVNKKYQKYFKCCPKPSINEDCLNLTFETKSFCARSVNLHLFEEFMEKYIADLSKEFNKLKLNYKFWGCWSCDVQFVSE